MDIGSGGEEILIPTSIRETASEDGAVLLDIEQGICFSLNPVGLKIWDLLKQHCSVERIVDELQESFLVERAQLLSDTLEFIAALEAKRLIRRGRTSEKQPSGLKKLVIPPWIKRRL